MQPRKIGIHPSGALASRDGTQTSSVKIDHRDRTGIIQQDVVRVQICMISAARMQHRDGSADGAPMFRRQRCAGKASTQGHRARHPPRYQIAAIGKAMAHIARGNRLGNRQP